MPCSASRQLIVGPDAATCLLVAASLAPLAAGDPERYLALLPVFTLMTGMLYLLAGAASFGFIAAFLSQPILTGYLNGIALIILVGQLPKLLGYPSADNEFMLQLRELALHLGQSHPTTALLGVAMLAGLVILRWVGLSIRAGSRSGSRPPDCETRPGRSISPDWYRLGVSPK